MNISLGDGVYKNIVYLERRLRGMVRYCILGALE